MIKRLRRVSFLGLGLIPGLIPGLILGLGLTLMAPMTPAGAATDTDPHLDPRLDPRLALEGFHLQPWMKVTTADLGKDLAAARAEGKILMLMWEQTGCIYCAELHQVNFKIPWIADYVDEKFYVVQLNIWGERAFRDFDGKELTEDDLANRHRVNGTPTLEFYQSGGREAFRMPGYSDPPIFLGILEYVATGGYRTASIDDWFKRNSSRLIRAWQENAVN